MKSTQPRNHHVQFGRKTRKCSSCKRVLKGFCKKTPGGYRCYWCHKRITGL